MADLPAVIGRYEIISRLGQGGMGSLYLAKDPKIGRLVAIKLVRQEFDSPEARHRFAREAQSAGTLRHPNIVTIFDVDEHESLPYIAMEYVDGETLGEIVRRKAPYPMAKRLQWIEELCGGLAYAHRQGVVHRDIKPANLMLDNEGALKILDFGLARREASKYTQSQTIIGTPNYMSPEQIRAGDVGPQSDIFAVGAVLYELLAYAEAFPGRVHEAMHKILYEEPKPLAQVIPEIDPGLRTILARALEKDPAKRFADLTVMRQDLAIVRQRLEHHRMDESVQTIALPPPHASPRRSGSAAGHAPASGAPGSGQGSEGSGGSRRTFGSAHRLTLQKKRAAQIDLHLAEARKLCDSGAFERAREEVEQALMFDPDLPLGLQLIDEIEAEEQRQRIAQLVAAARAELQQGRLEAAERMVAQALELAPQSPDIVSLRDTIDTTRRELDRARQATDMLRRARTRFSEGSFEGAIRAAGEILAIDPNNAAARELLTRANEAMEAKAKRAERDAAAQAVVTEARALFEKGAEETAIAMLEAFTPPHDLVTGFLGSLRGEQVEKAHQEPAPPAPVSAVSVQPPASSVSMQSPVPSASMESPASSVSGVSPTSPSAPVASAFRRNTQRSRTPLYAGLAVAAVAVIGIGFYSMSDSGPRGGPENAATTAAATPEPVPVIPPPAAVTTPASLTDSSPKNQSDRDAMEAYKLLAAGKPAEASRLVARIAKRDPTNENLAELRTQTQKVVDTEKQRAAAIAAAAAANVLANAPASAPPTGSPGPTSAATDKPAAPPVANNPVPMSPAAPPPAAPAKPEVTAPPAVAAPPPPSPAEVEKPGIEASIQEYAKAMSSMNLPAVGQVRRFTPAQAKNWDTLFKSLSSYRLHVKVLGAPIVNGDTATIPVEEQVATAGKKDKVQMFQTPKKMDYKLEKIGGKWMILPPG